MTKIINGEEYSLQYNFITGRDEWIKCLGLPNVDIASLPPVQVVKAKPKQLDIWGDGCPLTASLF